MFYEMQKTWPTRFKQVLTFFLSFLSKQMILLLLSQSLALTADPIEYGRDKVFLSLTEPPDG